MRELLTASAPWLISLNLLRSKPGTAASAAGSVSDFAAISTIVSRCPASAESHSLSSVRRYVDQY